jgi:leucine dehydrogenase
MASPWELPDFDDHEGLHLFRDSASGLSAIIAVHSSHLGPAAGGVRFWHYATDDAAITDALRLSRGMSYKNAVAGLKMGGGKGVILADSNKSKSRALVEAFARAIDSLAGGYVTAQDVGMTSVDMQTIGTITRHVAGLPPRIGGAGGDPGPATALGVFYGVRAAAERALGSSNLSGVHVAVQGVGSVGGGLARHLAAAGARLTLADVDDAKARALAAELSADLVSTSDIMQVEADIYSPCALGAVLDGSTIALLNVKAVAGGANNQLAKSEHGPLLNDRGILYAPDYVINAGGIINVALQYLDDANASGVLAKLEEIPQRLHAIWDESSATGRTAEQVADRMARRLIGRPDDR